MSNLNAMQIIVAIRRARNALRRLTRSARRRLLGGQRSPDRSPFIVNARPIHAYIALESSPTELQRLLSQIAQEPGHSRDHTPVIFTDSTDFSAIADSGAVFEYLPDREMWQRHRPDWLWDSFVQERLAELDRCYRPCRTIVISGPDDAPRG